MVDFVDWLKKAQVHYWYWHFKDRNGTEVVRGNKSNFDYEVWYFLTIFFMSKNDLKRWSYSEFDRLRSKTSTYKEIDEVVLNSID